GGEAATVDRQASRGDGRELGLAAQEPARQRRDRPRQSGGAGDQRARYRIGAVSGLWSELDLDDLRAGGAVQSAARAAAEVSRARRLALATVPEIAAGTADAAERDHSDQPRRGSVDHQSFGPASVGYHFVQLETGRRPG